MPITLAHLRRALLHRWRAVHFSAVELPFIAPSHRARLERRLAGTARPRVAFVKQDVQDDLYCCGPGATPREVVLSTLMRTGPVALFTKLDAEFILVQTEPDPECNVWQEKWTDCKWCPIEWFEAFREQVPGRDYGQKDFAVPAADVDWGRYDIVISVDVSVPARLTRQYPDTLWCYSIREVKTGSYTRSKTAPIAGQDVFLNQRFRRLPEGLAAHELEFPYYLQYHGCFHDLLGEPRGDEKRAGVFIEHQTAAGLDAAEIAALAELGPVRSTAVSRADGTFENEMTKSQLEPEAILRDLMASRYFLQLGGQRRVFGNGLIEAVAAGCLVLGDPNGLTHADLLSRGTSVRTFKQAMKRLWFFEQDANRRARERHRQQRLVDYLCFTRPLTDLLARFGPRSEVRGPRSEVGNARLNREIRETRETLQIRIRS